MPKIKVTVAEPSPIIRSGVIAQLRKHGEAHLEISEIGDMAQLRNSLAWQKPDILIINPIYPGVQSLQPLRKDAGNKQMKCVALNSMSQTVSPFNIYDEVLSLGDSQETLKEKIYRIIKSFSEPDKDKRNEPLSAREKEVVAYVVKGMTNKQIADEMSLSTHTVITHRRNISSKLQIHSTAGLTIYAIVNNLVELNDVKSVVLSEE